MRKVVFVGERYDCFSAKKIARCGLMQSILDSQQQHPSEMKYTHHRSIDAGTTDPVGARQKTSSCSNKGTSRFQSTYNTSLQRWFKQKQNPLWSRCVDAWKQAVPLELHTQGVSIALNKWEQDFMHATRSGARKEQRGSR